MSNELAMEILSALKALTDKVVALEQRLGQPGEDQNDLLKIPEAAAKLRVDRGRIYELVRKGELPAVKARGARMRILRRDLDLYIKRTRRVATRH